jgi:glutamate synthase (ferredoxin)
MQSWLNYLGFEVGVGTHRCSRCCKGKADVILISGYDGGTGAAPLTSLQHTGIPWELGLASRQIFKWFTKRIVLECDGQLKQVAMWLLLHYGAENLVLQRRCSFRLYHDEACHLNTCPVGIATQDPELRKKFQRNSRTHYQLHVFYCWRIKRNHGWI